ncbi:MAG: 4-hydroxy-tetrahydrodipicolinate reductase, partial [Flavobacteriales bacterium]
MQIALIGYGKMGKTIEPLLLSRGHQIHSIFDSTHQVNAAELSGASVAIEFTRPELALHHIRICAEAGCAIVTGTTGWNHQREEAFSIINELNGALFYASNFSLGVNIAFHLTEILTSILANFPNNKPTIEEIHHTQKLDAPSGTAISFADKIMGQNHSYKGWKLSEKSGAD